MHDTFHFETQAVPSVFVASDAFADAAAAQAHALGMPDVRAVYVAHPIQDATDAELVTKADAVYDEVVAALVSRHPG